MFDARNRALIVPTRGEEGGAKCALRLRFAFQPLSPALFNSRGSFEAWYKGTRDRSVELYESLKVLPRILT